MVRFDGIIRQDRRGGWNARGIIVTHKHGQIFQTLVGPRAFASEEISQEWLRAAATELAIEEVTIVVQKHSELDNA
jgi:hypothetical protein